MKIAVSGTGAVGGYSGGRLALARYKLQFLARGAHLQAIKEKGLRVESINGDFTVHPANVTDDPSGLDVPDVVLVTLKTWQVKEVAPKLQGVVGPQTTVVPMQNGVEARNELAAIFGEERVVGGTCRIISFIGEPGLIRHTGAEPDTFFGEWDGSPSQRLKALEEAYLKAGVKAEAVSDIQTRLWEKYMFVVAFGTVGAAARVPVGVMRSVPESRSLLEGAMHEIRSLAEARGVPMKEGIVDRFMGYIDKLKVEATTSMQREMADGKPTEFEQWTGGVVRLAQESGVAVPIHDVIYRALAPLEKQARGELS